MYDLSGSSGGGPPRPQGATTNPTLHPPRRRDDFGRIASSLASDGARLERRLSMLAVATRSVTVVAGIGFGITNPPETGSFVLAAVVLVAFAIGASWYQLEVATLSSTAGLALLVAIELSVTVGIVMATGGFRSPFIVTPITGLLLAGYAFGATAVIGTVVAGVIATAVVIAIQIVDPTGSAAAGQIAVVYLLCGALGAFTRNLVTELEAQRAAAIDQAAQMATANDLLVSLHGLAQTLPASFDLGEVVDSIRQRVRALFPYTALVLLVPDDAGDEWRTELAEGVRVPARLAGSELPAPIQRAMGDGRPVVVARRTTGTGDDGFADLCASGIYTALRARGALVGVIAIEHLPAHAYGAEERELLESLSGVLALSLDNARWFGRLHTLGAEAERGRIARELHDRIAQSLAYITFELERLRNVPGEKQAELENLREVTRDVMQQLRETIYQLRANVSEDDDFTDVATDYLSRFEERTGIRTTWLPGPVDRRLPFRVEQELWRIAQEALANVDRHSAATQVAVRWAVDERSARLEIADNGTGFDPDGVAGDHYGILGMRERADAIGARLQIHSRVGRGTSVVVALDNAVTTAGDIRRSA